MGGAVWSKDSKERLEYGRRRNRFVNYGLTHERYLALLNSQGGRCATCARPEYQDNVALVVDHDHACCPGKKSCGKCVRALLCERCNRVDGFLRSNPDNAFAMAVYLTPKPIGTLFVMKERA